MHVLEGKVEDMAQPYSPKALDVHLPYHTLGLCASRLEFTAVQEVLSAFVPDIDCRVFSAWPVTFQEAAYGCWKHGAGS